jgi:hypothetical protein
LRSHRGYEEDLKPAAAGVSRASKLGTLALGLLNET